MSRRTPNEEEALAWYCKEKDLCPQLFSHPVYYFLNREGKEVKANIVHILSAWKKARNDK